MHHFHPHGAAGHAPVLQMPQKCRKRVDARLGKAGIFHFQKPGKFLQSLSHGKLVGGAQAFLRGQKTDEAFQMSLHGGLPFLLSVKTVPPGTGIPSRSEDGF